MISSRGVVDAHHGGGGTGVAQTRLSTTPAPRGTRQVHRTGWQVAPFARFRCAPVPARRCPTSGRRGHRGGPDLGNGARARRRRCDVPGPGDLQVVERLPAGTADRREGGAGLVPGCRSSRCRAISACIVMAERPCPTTRRTPAPPVTSPWSACVRANWIRSRATAPRCSRTATPTANGTTTHADAGTIANSPSATPRPKMCNDRKTSATTAARAARRTGTCRGHGIHGDQQEHHDRPVRSRAPDREVATVNVAWANTGHRPAGWRVPTRHRDERVFYSTVGAIRRRDAWLPRSAAPGDAHADQHGRSIRPALAFRSGRRLDQLCRRCQAAR